MATQSAQPETVGLDPEAAAELCAIMRVAGSSAQPDHFRRALVASALVIGLLLAVGMFQRWRFASNLTAFNPRTSLPSPLYSAAWHEPPRTMDQIMLSLRDMRR